MVEIPMQMFNTALNWTLLSFPLQGCYFGVIPPLQLDTKLFQDSDVFLSLSPELTKLPGLWLKAMVTPTTISSTPTSFLQFHLYIQKDKLPKPKIYSSTWVQALNLYGK